MLYRVEGKSQGLYIKVFIIWSVYLFCWCEREINYRWPASLWFSVYCFLLGSWI